MAQEIGGQVCGLMILRARWKIILACLFPVWKKLQVRLLKSQKSGHWCLNGPLYKMISFPRPDYPDLVRLLHTHYPSCLLYVFIKGTESFTPVLSHFSRILLSFYLLALTHDSIPSNHSTFFYVLTVTQNKQCFAFVFHLPFSAFSQTDIWTSEVYCIKHSKSPDL